jgi:hypothetical protein
LWRPINVGAIDPVGMTNASASNARKSSASVKAMTIASTVSRWKMSGSRTTSPGRGPLLTWAGPLPTEAGPLPTEADSGRGLVTVQASGSREKRPSGYQAVATQPAAPHG